MSYMLPSEWWTGYNLLRTLRDSYVPAGTMYKKLDEIVQIYFKMIGFAGALYSPQGNEVEPVPPLILNHYQLHNLTDFLLAVREHPDDAIGQYNSGDWWGEVLYKLIELGGDFKKSNKRWYWQED